MFRKAEIRFWIYVVLGLFSATLLSANELIIPESMERSLLYEISGLRALNYITGLCNFDRSGASRGLYEAQLWIFDKLKNWGITEVELESFPADGKTLYLDTHPAGYAWEKERAVLTMVEPHYKKIIDYDEIPTALVKYSNSANLTAEVIAIGQGTGAEDYAGKDVAGKIVFTSSPASEVYEKACKELGAVGIISYWKNYEPDRSRFPDQVPWMAIPQELDTSHFGFAVSETMAQELKELLAKNKVVVKAEVEAQNKVGQYHILSSAIMGNDLPEKEVIMTAHINHYKPGANDNASGSALLMEVERAIRALIDAGKMPTPRRTIRFVWVQEHIGTKVYLDNRPELGQMGIMAINLDMVGENLLLCESSVRLVLGPHSCSSFLDDLMNNLLQYVSRSNFEEYRGTKVPFTYVLDPYNGAISDHFYYPSPGIGIPVSFLFVWPDNFYHSNEDTPDKCDPTLLKRLGFVSAAAALYVASAGEKEARDLCDLVYSEGSKRLIQSAKAGIDLMRESKGNDLYTAYKEALNKLSKTAQRESLAIRSALKLSETSSTRGHIRERLKALNHIHKTQKSLLSMDYQDLCRNHGLKAQKISLTDKERRFSRIIPQRHFRGPLYLKTIKAKLDAEKRKWMEDAEQRIKDFFLIKDEIINFIDNKNSILDIRNEVSSEFYPLDLDDVFNFLENIGEAGYISFAEKVTKG